MPAHGLPPAFAALAMLAMSGVVEAQAPPPDWSRAPRSTTSPALQRQAQMPAARLAEAPEVAAPEATGQAVIQQLRPDQQIARMQRQIRELQQRLTSAEQLLASHVHVIEQDSYRKEKYRTMKHFLDTNLDYEYLVPGGRLIQKETSPPMVSGKRSWP